jgi:hypothetical protein
MWEVTSSDLEPIIATSEGNWDPDESYEEDEDDEEEEEEEEEEGRIAWARHYFLGLMGAKPTKGKGKGKNSIAAKAALASKKRQEKAEQKGRGKGRGATRGASTAASRGRGRGKRAEQMRGKGVESMDPAAGTSGEEMPPPSYECIQGRRGRNKNKTPSFSGSSHSMRQRRMAASSSTSGSSRPGSRPSNETEDLSKLFGRFNVHRNITEPYPEGVPDPFDADKKYCFIENLNLMIDNVSPESYRGPATRWDAIHDFVNLQTTQSFLGTNQTNSIEYNAFVRNCFVGSWNLSNSTNPNTPLMQPTVPKSNSVQIRVEFSQATPEELVMITWTQLATTMTIDSKRNVGLSYYNTYNN